MAVQFKGKKYYDSKKNEEYDAILREHYEDGGAAECKQYIPELTETQITRRANYIGLVLSPKISKRNGTKISEWTIKGYDDIIREKYPTGGPSACMPHMPEKTRGQISGRANVIKIGLNNEGRSKIARERSLAAAETKKRQNEHKRALKIEKENKDKINKFILIEEIDKDPFICGEVPPSIKQENTKCEYYLQRYF